MNGTKKIFHSPYRRGADYGAWFGLYLTALFFATAYSMSQPPLGLLSLVLMSGVPAVIYIMLRRSYVSDLGKTLFSSLWMEGIMIFLCGGMIASFIAVMYMRWIEPNFLDHQVTMMIDLYNSTDWERGKEFAEMLQRARDQHLIPRPIELAVDMLWLIVFSGSILSMLMSLLVQARSVKPKKV